MRATRTGIIGAGMAGIACARLLTEEGHTVRLFDKGRGPGGRVSARRVATPRGEAMFDHGAQYVTARHPDFIRQIETLREAGIVARWPEAGPEAWVGTPQMNAIPKHLARGLDMSFGCMIRGLTRSSEGWQIIHEKGSEGPFDRIVVALPAEQAASILGLHDLLMARHAVAARSAPCWAGLFVFPHPVEGEAVLRNKGTIAWAARNSSEPGRTGPEAWTIHASAEWSVAHLEEDAPRIAHLLGQEFARLVGHRIGAPISATAHRWRYAESAATGLGALWNERLAMGACGDWLIGPRVEDAWLSGRELAGLMLTPSAQSAPSRQAYGP